MARVDPDEASEEMMVEIDAHGAAGSSVPRSTSIKYYRLLAGMCRDRANLIEREMENEDE